MKSVHHLAVTPAPTPAAPGWIDVAAGASLGALMGLLVGLSASPVVGGVVAGLVGLLAGVFGLSEKLPAGGLGRVGAARLAVFGIAALLATVLGIVLRTSERLAPSVEQQRAQLASIGITEPAEVRDMLPFLRYGLQPAGTTAVGKDGDAARQALASRQGVLYAGSTPEWCATLRARVRDGAPASDLLISMRSGPPDAQAAARRVAALPSAEQRAAAAAAPLYLCSD